MCPVHKYFVSCESLVLVFASTHYYTTLYRKVEIVQNSIKMDPVR